MRNFAGLVVFCLMMILSASANADIICYPYQASEYSVTTCTGECGCEDCVVSYYVEYEYNCFTDSDGDGYADGGGGSSYEDPYPGDPCEDCQSLCWSAYHTTVTETQLCGIICREMSRQVKDECVADCIAFEC